MKADWMDYSAEEVEEVRVRPARARIGRAGQLDYKEDGMAC